MWQDLWSFILWTLKTRSILILASLGDLICQACVQQLVMEAVDHFEHLLFHGVFRRGVLNRNFLALLLMWRFLMDILPDEGAVGGAHRVRIL